MIFPVEKTHVVDFVAVAVLGSARKENTEVVKVFELCEAKAKSSTPDVSGASYFCEPFPISCEILFV